MQYNYSHDNYGPGFLLFQFAGARTWGKNIVRYNISQNDARRNSYGGVTLSGGVANAVVENNTIYIKPSTTGGVASAVRLTGVGAGVAVRNNILFTTGNTLLVDADGASTAARFNNNDYWPGGASFRIRWAGTTTLTSLNAFRGKGQEMSGSTPTGRNVDPKLVSAGAGPTFNDASKLETLTQYTLRSDSPLRSTASLTNPVYSGYAASIYDFFNRSIAGTREIGAAEA
jgi:hypothetical protein